MAESSSKMPMLPHFPVEEVPLSLIDLDLRNSRFPRDARTQSDAVELMLNTAGDDCLQMLKDITRSGRLNSSDIPIVVAHNGRYVMMEGNRRLTCLRLWANPELLREFPSLEQQYLSRVERMAEESAFSPPTVLRVTISPNEAEADLWVERKHSRGAGGAGTVEWGAAMKDRRQARNDPTKASRAMAFVELVSREYEQVPEILLSLEKVRSKRYSFIQRFVDRKVVRELIGLDYSEGKMTFRHGAELSMPIIRQVLTDFSQPKAESGKTWARELDTVEDFRIYLDKYSDLLPINCDTGTRVTYDSDHYMKRQVEIASDLSGKEQGVQTNGGYSGENSRKNKQEGSIDLRPPRPTVAPDFIFRGLTLDKFTPRIQEIVRQTSLLSVSKQNETVSVMLRVILDLTTYQFLKSHGCHDVPNHLDKRIKQAIRIIEPNASNALGNAEDTSRLSQAFHATTSDSIRLVHYAVHSIYNGRTPSEVLTLAERYTPVLQAMNANMGKVSVR